MARVSLQGRATVGYRPGSRLNGEKLMR
jgi:hypothetical protein